jgi:pyruvate/2-oxoglutarate dehydrogenase complex dihydrolipoamide dehydrogenase (E3) component
MSERSTTDRARDHRTEADVIVLGVGTCGEDLSLRLLGAGLSVIGIEASLVGGECPYWACLPSKMMIRAANALQEARRVGGLAGSADVTPDWQPVAARVRTEATGDWDDSVAVARFESRGGRLIHGRGRLAGSRTVVVGDETLIGRRGVVIATGSRAMIPAVPGLSDVPYWTTHDVISRRDLPRSLTILGGGAVGCELGQTLARFGVDVAIVEAAGRLLPAEEPEASEAVLRALTAEGVEARTGSSVRQVSEAGGRITVTLDDGAEISRDHLLVATGRTVDLGGLGLETVGLDATAHGIPVDARMRAADGLWAMGDVTGRGPFTHVALHQSGIIAADILGDEEIAPADAVVPRVTFTDPEVGAVGLTEAQAQAAGRDVVVAVKNVPSTFRGWLHATEGGVIKLIADRQTDILVGATAVGPHGGELLGLLGLAVQTGVTLRDLRSMIYAFPTFYGGVGEAVGAYGRGLGTVLDPGYRGFQPVSAETTPTRG